MCSMVPRPITAMLIVFDYDVEVCVFVSLGKGWLGSEPRGTLPFDTQSGNRRYLR